MSVEPAPGLKRLIGHHPAAIRSVAYQDSAEDRLYHLEIETKHGQVSLIHHSTGEVFCNPPIPPDASGPRLARDLTVQLPEAFNGRPTIEAIEARETSGTMSYRFALSTGAAFSFVTGESGPLLSHD